MPMRTLIFAHDSARAQFDKLSDTSHKMAIVGQGLAQLAKLGNLVDPEDVIRESAKLVASGIDPHQLAGMLAQMPQVGGEPLQAWLMTQARALAQAQAQIAPVYEEARHQLAGAALGVLMGQHMELPGQPMGAPKTSGPPQNDLTTPPPDLNAPANEYIEPPPAAPDNLGPANPLELMSPQGRA